MILSLSKYMSLKLVILSIGSDLLLLCFKIEASYYILVVSSLLLPFDIVNT
jgi:hypothetical protein